jgi:hypothetical protein
MLLMAARLIRDWPGYLRARVAHGPPEVDIRERLQARVARFLGVLEHQALARRESPYSRLFRMAGCELGDVHEMVHRDGIDSTLRTLAAAGVYVTFDEIKGRREAVRGSSRVLFRQEEFDNPLADRLPGFIDHSSGTGGRPSIVKRPLHFDLETAVNLRAVFNAHGVAGSSHLFYMTAPFVGLAIKSLMGERTEAWFHPLRPLPWQVRVAALGFKAISAVGGVTVPLPRYCPLDEPWRIVDWLRRGLDRPRTIGVTCFVSAAARIAQCATARGVSLDRVFFHTLGEPYTPGRKRLIEASGARTIVDYGTQEVPTMAFSCVEPHVSDDVHLFSDIYAAVDHRRPAVDDGPEVDALLLTSLSRFGPKLILNVETGDSARIEHRACGCALGRLGYDTHLSDIRSFEKLSGEGMTFARSDITRLVEDELPARFGGASLDYQLVEQEMGDGLTRLRLLVDPAIGALDESAIREFVLTRLAQGGLSARHSAELWRRAGTVQVDRVRPAPTSAGKVLPFRLVRLGTAG